MISKKPIRKTQGKLQPQETANSNKTEGGSNGSTTGKVAGISQDAEASKGSNEECQNQDVNNSESKNDMELKSETDVSQNGAVLLNSTTPELVSYEVTVA